MSKYYSKRINVSGHTRYDPRIKKRVSVDSYPRNQRYRDYKTLSREEAIKKFNNRSIKQKKSITNKEFLLGDFDKDKIKNVDDKYPFKKSEETIEEMQLSDALITLDKVHKKSDENRKIIIKKFRKIIKQTNPQLNYDEIKKKTPSRTKTPLSLLHKSLKYQIPETTDKIGIMYVGKNYKDLNRIKSALKKNFEVIEERDYYKNPKLGYKAIHLILKENLTGERFEVQLKSKRIKRLSDINHTLYKRNIQNTREFKRLVNLGEKADKGDKESQKYLDNLSNNEVKNLLSKKE